MPAVYTDLTGQEVLRLDYTDVHEGVTRACNYYLRTEKPIKTIVAVSRGGLVPATVLSHLLGIRDVQVIQAASYTDNRKQHKVNLQFALPLQEVLQSAETLVVDDIYDTGQTMAAIKNVSPNSLKFCLVSKQLLMPSRTGIYCSIIAEPNQWVKFPWERD